MDGFGDSSRSGISLVPTANEKLITKEGDLPAPDAGVISLEADTKYIFVGLVDIANKLKPPTDGNCQLIADTIYSGINYTGSDSLFENTSLGTGRFVTLFMAIKTPSGTLYNIEGTAGGFVIASNIFFEDCDSLGTVKGSAFTLFFDDFRDIGQGIIADSNSGFTYGRNFITNGKNQVGTSIITIRGAHNVIQVANNFPFTNGANENVLDIEASSTVTSASVTGNAIDTNAGGGIFAPGSKNQTSIGWKFTNNPGDPTGIPDSTVTAEAFFTGPATTTVGVGQTSALFIANLSGVTGDNEERTTVGDDGAITYNGKDSVKMVLNGNVNIEPSLGQNKVLTARYAVVRPTDISCTFTNATNVVNAIGHGLLDGDNITFHHTGGTLPAELQDDIVYYVVNKADDTFQISYTLGGAAVTFTDDGSGSNIYEQAFLSGSAGSADINATDPADISPKAITCSVPTDSEIFILVANTTDTADIVINSSYARLNKA